MDTKKVELSRTYTNIIIDGQNFCYRAGVVDNLKNKRGEPVYVSYISLKMLRGLVEKFSPKRVIITWDGGHSTWRKFNYPRYKLKKPYKPEALRKRDEILSQINTVRTNIFSMFPIIQWRKVKYEADDLVYAIVKVLSNKSGNTLIISSDKDYYQLLPYADILSAITESPYTRRSFKKDYGFNSEYWPSFRALTGDPSDNITGVYGVGKKTALKILQENTPEVFCSKWPEDPASKIISKQMDVLIRNLTLISLNMFPDRVILKKEFRQLLKDFEPVLEEKKIKKYFVANTFVSMLREYPAWIQPFKELL